MDEGDQNGAVDDSEGAHGSEEFGRFKQKLGALRDIARETPGDDPIEPDAAGLSPEDVDRLDLDGDEAISPWELERSQRLVERAERHPVKNDVYDGAYPVERGDYARPEWEFDAIDTNRDDLMDVEEYYSFLFEAERTSHLLDTNGDGYISPDESGLAEAEFAPLDRDGSGFLMPWEMRQGVALGAFDGD